MPSLTLKIPNDSDKARNILRECQIRVKESESKLSQKHKEWRQAEEKTLAYLPEREIDAARRVNRESGGMPEYTTIQIPYSFAVLMAAHTYLTSVFMGRSPVWQYTGRHGESQQQVQAMEAVIDYQLMVGKMLVPLYTWLYDGCKYGAGAVGLFWDERYDNISQIVEKQDADVFGNPSGPMRKLQQTIRQRTYTGNRIYNIQIWDFLWDTRYPLRDFQKGEYLALRFNLGWNDIKRREALGYYMNIEELATGSVNTSGFGSADVGSEQLFRPSSTDSSSWQTETTGLVRKHPMEVKGYEVYIDIIPKEWGVSPSEEPEKWVFTITADYKTLIGAQPHGALHAQFPAAVLPLEPEGYGLVTRGIPKILEPIQQTVDWLINSHFFNVRAALNNKLIVDPSKIVMKDLLNPLPGGVVRLKPEAYGTDPKVTYTQLTIQDMTRTHLNDVQLMFGIGERTMGINDQIMGMLNGGGRKTATEVRTSTSFGVNRLKTIAEWFSAIGFDPLSMMLVQNTQQYYDTEQKFKIAGDLLMNAGESFITVDPSSIGGFYDFVPVDGTLPIDRYAQANLWRELMGQMRNFPQLMMGYDLMGIFEWVAQLTGLKNISRFKLQITPEQQLQAAMQAGNVLPLNGPQAGGKSKQSTSAGGGPQPSQVSGMGVAG